MILNNRRGQAITRPYYLVLVLVMMSIFSYALLEFGQDLAGDPNSDITDESRTYIFEKSGFNPTRNISQEDTTDLFYSQGNGTSGSAKDFTLEFQFFRDSSSEIRDIGQAIWEAPTFFISNLGLDLGSWSVIINFIFSIIYVIIFYNIYRILRGSI